MNNHELKQPRQPYEFDIRIPMLMRGPGIPVNVASEASNPFPDENHDDYWSFQTPALMIDLAPTLLHIAGLEDQALEVILSSSDLTAVIVSFFWFAVVTLSSCNLIVVIFCIHSQSQCNHQLDGESLLSRENVEREFLVEYSGEGGEGVDKYVIILVINILFLIINFIIILIIKLFNKQCLCHFLVF